MTTTTNLNLKKPEYSDDADIGDINDNMDIIDGAYGNLATGKVPSTRKVNGHALSSDVTVTKGDVGLGNVDNTSDVNKPISNAQALVNTNTANQIIDLKSALNYVQQEIAFNANASIYSFRGYLMADGSIGGASSSYGKATQIIPCKQGDIFWYKGLGQSNAISVFYYSGNVISSTEKYNSKTTYTKITIPSGIDGVKFASFASSASAVVLSVLSPSGYRDLFDNNIDVRISDIEEQRLDELKNDIWIVSEGTLISGKYLSCDYDNGGWIREADDSGSKITDYIPVIPGEKVLVSGYSQWSAVVYALYDSNKNPVSVYPLTYSSTVTNAQFVEVTIPDGAYYIRASSYSTANSNPPRIRKSDKFIAKKAVEILNDKALANDWESVTLENTTAAYLTRYCTTPSYSNAKLSDYEEVTPGETILVTGKCADGARLAAFYDANNVLLGSYPDMSIESPSITAVDTPVTVPYSAKYVRISAVYSTTIGLKKRVPIKDLINNPKSNVLYGKKYIAIGDSFTHGDFNGLPDTHASDIWDAATNQYKTYPWQIANRNGMQLTNLAVNGSKLVDFAANARWTEIPADTDYCTIMYGLNDYSASIPIGTETDTTADTFCGAWNMILDWLNNNRKDLKIGIIICSAYLGNSYRTASENMAKRYGVPFLNLYTDPKVPIFMGKSGVPSDIANVKYQYYKVTETNGHPNIKAHIFESTFIEDFMRGL